MHRQATFLSLVTVFLTTGIGLYLEAGPLIPVVTAGAVLLIRWALPKFYPMPQLDPGKG